MECVRLFYFSSLCWNICGGLFRTLARPSRGLERVFWQALRPNSLHWPDSFLCSILVPSSLVHWPVNVCPHLNSQTYLLPLPRDSVWGLCPHSRNVARINRWQEVLRGHVWSGATSRLCNLVLWGEILTEEATQSSTWLLGGVNGGRVCENSNRTEAEIKGFLTPRLFGLELLTPV